jgi:hypothetical protein
MEEWLNHAWTVALTAVPIIGGAWLWIRVQVKGLKQDTLEARAAQAAAEANERKAVAEARKIEIELRGEEVKVDDDEARATQKRKQEQSDWAVKQAMQLYEETKKQIVIALFKVDKAVQAESQCRVLVATLYTQVRELQRKQKIDRSDPVIDEWVDRVLNPKEGDRSDLNDPTGTHHG